MKVVTAVQMREMDRHTIEDLGVPSLELMERAGAAVANLVRHRVSPIQEARIAVVCGKGNNGGDGFVVARHLNDAGAKVTVLPVASRGKCSPDCQANWGRLEQSIKVLAPGTTSAFSEFDAIVDAVYGTGYDASRAGEAREEGAVLDAILAVQDRVRVVAVDIPSGLDATTGKAGPRCVQAWDTVTFGGPKRGMFTADGPGATGRLHVVPIGVEESGELGDAPRAITSGWLRDVLPRFRDSAHKGDRGSVLCVGGSTTMPGSIALTAFAALKAGAGLSTCAVPESIHAIVAGYRPELMTIPLPDAGSGCLTEEAAEAVLAMLPNYDVLALGPGVTTQPPVRAAVKRFLENAEKPIVLDADGLNCLAEIGPVKHKAPLVLTPHPGEMARLMETDNAAVLADRFGIVEKCGSRFDATIVLKGAFSLVYRDGNGVAVNLGSAPGLATAGSGDVLTGAIAALVHQVGSPFEAACAGVWLHCPPVISHQLLGGTPVGDTAMDIAMQLPHRRTHIMDPRRYGIEKTS